MCQAWFLKVRIENKIAKFSWCLIGQRTPNPKPKTNGLAWIKPYFYLFLQHMVAQGNPNPFDNRPSNMRVFEELSIQPIIALVLRKGFGLYSLTVHFQFIVYLDAFKRKKNPLNKNQGQEPIHQKYTANENTSISNFLLTNNTWWAHSIFQWEHAAFACVVVLRSWVFEGV